MWAIKLNYLKNTPKSFHLILDYWEETVFGFYWRLLCYLLSAAKYSMLSYKPKIFQSHVARNLLHIILHLTYRNLEIWDLLQLVQQFGYKESSNQFIYTFSPFLFLFSKQNLKTYQSDFLCSCIYDAYYLLFFNTFSLRCAKSFSHHLALAVQDDSFSLTTLTHIHSLMSPKPR